MGGTPSGGELAQPRGGRAPSNMERVRAVRPSHAYNMRDYYVVPNSRGACANLKTRTCRGAPDALLAVDISV